MRSDTLSMSGMWHLFCGILSLQSPRYFQDLSSFCYFIMACVHTLACLHGCLLRLYGDLFLPGFIIIVNGGISTYFFQNIRNWKLFCKTFLSCLFISVDMSNTSQKHHHKYTPSGITCCTSYENTLLVIAVCVA